MTGRYKFGRLNLLFPFPFQIMSKASDSLKKVTLELGGKSPLIIFDDVDMKNAVSTAMLANFFSQGAVSDSRNILFLIWEGPE